MNANKFFGGIVIALLIAWAVSVNGGGTFVPASKVTSVTWVYEKDTDGKPPWYVETGLNRINQEKEGVVATLCEDDPDNGAGQIPTQYKLQIEEARKTEGPDLVVLSGNTVVKSIKGADITTEEDVVKTVP